MSIALSNSNFILIASEIQLFAYDPVKSKCVVVCNGPKNAIIEDIAYEPLTAATLLLARGTTDGQNTFGIEALLKNESKTGSVFTRRVPYMQGLTFDANGQMYFGARGDLWHGSVEWESDESEDFEKAIDSKLGGVNIATVVGYRCAPLATHETYVGTPMEMGVQQVAVSDGMVYAHVLRMGGTGWGSIVRFRKPLPLSEESFGDFKKRMEAYSNALGSLELLGENGGQPFLCASQDGERVFYRTAKDEGEAYWLIENDTEPREIEFRD